MRQVKSIAPDKPYFLYVAPGATHAPHQTPKDWIDKFKGKFDMGWDQYREETLARQKKLGVVPQGHQADRPLRRACRRGTRSTPTRSGSTRG